MSDQPDPAPTVEENSEIAKPRLSRREFARRAALASAVASIAPTAAVTAPPSGAHTTTQDSLPATPQNSTANPPRLSAESQTEADARFQSILVLYGPRFSNEQKNDLHRLCAAVQPSLDHIRAYKVGNGDGPALYLEPLYEREKKPKAPEKTAKSPVVKPTTSPEKPPAAPKTP
jgi:hypothetical protein